MKEPEGRIWRMVSSNFRLKSKAGRPDGQNQWSACQNMVDRPRRTAPTGKGDGKEQEKLTENVLFEEIVLGVVQTYIYTCGETRRGGADCGQQRGLNRLLLNRY